MELMSPAVDSFDRDGTHLSVNPAFQGAGIHS